MVIDARGATGVNRFADRVNSVAILAESCDELTIADILSGLAASLFRDHDRDVRPFIYEQLDRLHGAQVMH
ncbi:MAG: hypothetical protein HY054_10900 [Proteobacteria bacterium]|nr:hypothetical protein [Pseudomonadota bacterium]